MEATGASHVMVMVVVPVWEMLTDRGGSGLGGAKKSKTAMQHDCIILVGLFYM